MTYLFDAPIFRLNRLKGELVIDMEYIITGFWFLTSDGLRTLYTLICKICDILLAWFSVIAANGFRKLRSMQATLCRFSLLFEGVMNLLFAYIVKCSADSAMSLIQPDVMS